MSSAAIHHRQRGLTLLEMLGAMTIMALSAYTAIQWKKAPHGIPELAAGALVVILHIWKRNALVSIIGGTLFYMALGRIM